MNSFCRPALLRVKYVRGERDETRSLLFRTVYPEVKILPDSPSIINSFEIISMKQHLTILASLLSLILTCNTSVFAEEKQQEQEPYYDISNRDETAREQQMLEEAEKRWRKKPPHQHTLDDAKNSARQGQQNHPRFLLRESTKENTMNETVEKTKEELMKKIIEEENGEISSPKMDESTKE